MRRAGQRCLNSIALLFATVAVTHGLSPECTSNLDNRLLLAEESKIWTVSPDGGNREILADSPSAISVDYSYARNTLYWSDLQTRQVYALKDGATKAKVAISVDSENDWLPTSVAVDDVTDKIYVADAFSNTVGVFDLNNDGLNAIVIGGNLIDVRDVEIDPHRGYLFVLDKYQIVRTNLDGSNPVIIHLEYGNLQEDLEKLNYELPDLHLDKPAKNNHPRRYPDEFTYRKPLSIADVALDTEEKRVYWIDAKLRSVQSSDYEGRDRRVHFRDVENKAKSSEPVSFVTLLNGSVYWADDDTKSVFKIDAKNSDKVEIVQKNVTPQSIKSISCSNHKRIDDPCENHYSKCQHLCLSSRSNERNYTCACKIGHELANDGGSCEPVRDFVLFTMYGYLRGLSIKSKSEIMNPWEFEVGHSAILDYNLADSTVYYTSAYPRNQLHQIDLRTKERRVLAKQDVHHFAYDWTTKNLYYFAYVKDSLGVFSLRVLNVDDPSYGGKIVLDKVHRLIRGVVVHPYRGYVYFAQYVDDRRGRICRVNTDGSDFTVLIDLGEKVMVDGLSLDYDEDRLYWIQRQSKIYNSNLNGQDIREISFPTTVKTLSSMIVHKDYIYAVTDDSLVRFNKKSNDSVVKLVESQDRHNTFSGLKLYSSTAQAASEDHPCKNHDCERFCFAVANLKVGLKRVCGCSDDERISDDGKTCVK